MLSSPVSDMRAGHLPPTSLFECQRLWCHRQSRIVRDAASLWHSSCFITFCIPFTIVHQRHQWVATHRWRHEHRMEYEPMVMSTTEPMDTPGSPWTCPPRTAPSSTALQTTVYDLLAALNAHVGPDEDAVVTAVVVHLLQTHRVICTSARAHYRLVWDGTERPTRSGPRAAVRLGSRGATSSA